MNYQLFTQILLQELRNALTPDIIPKQIPCTKNNDVKEDGIAFIAAPNSPFSGVYPVISPKLYYDRYRKGAEMPDIVSDILEILEHRGPDAEFSQEQFMQYENMKDSICLKLIGRKFNQELLKNTPFIACYDLALVCTYFYTDPIKNVTATLLLKNEQLTQWHITKKELFETAAKNTPRIMHAHISHISEILREMGKTEEGLFPSGKLYVLTNQFRHYGAVCMTFPDILKKFADEKKTNLVLIPSSIHEILILPDHGSIPVSLNETIAQINDLYVKPEDRLSDHYYYYNRDKGLIQY